MKRIPSIDFARGLVMIIMALDHTRDFLHVDSPAQDPTNLATTTPALFLTRWVTHFCAPTFVFLAGMSAYLSRKRGAEVGKPERGVDARGKNGSGDGKRVADVAEGKQPFDAEEWQQRVRENRRLLLSRGIWLVVLEFTLVNFALWADIHFRTLIFEVIGTIGCGFIILSLLYHVSPKVLGILGLVLISGLGLLSGAMLPGGTLVQFAGSLLMGPGVFPLGPHRLLIVAYPILPWLGIMLAGYRCGQLFELPAAARKKLFTRIGWTALALFIFLRTANVYGNPTPWTPQKNAFLTFLSFINYSKYPPSLSFDLVTLGSLLLLLAFSEGKENRFTKFATVYGKVPLFYFVMHMYVIHFLMFVMVFGQGFRPADLVFVPAKFGRPAGGSGLTLPWIYLVWLAVVGGMYPLCRWYGRYKAAHPERKWLRYC